LEVEHKLFLKKGTLIGGCRLYKQPFTPIKQHLLQGRWGKDAESPFPTALNMGDFSESIRGIFNLI
jgi:hypothetical protein